MKLIKLRYLDATGSPKGRPYTFGTPEDVSVGDVVQINKDSQGIVTDVDVSGENLGFPLSVLKSIIGKAGKGDADA